MINYILLIGLALAGVSSSAFGNFADLVVSYEPGVGYARTFSGVGYTNAVTALGQPGRNTSFGPVQPFNPPFDETEIVSMGTNGVLVLRMAAPVVNASGADFVMYGNAGFIDVDYPNGRTDSAGSTFGENPGITRVRVSPDNVSYFLLDPSITPVVDQLFPTDGAGQFGVPVNPAISRSNFHNVSLEQIRALYAGSAGGTAYDVDWARDGAGNPVVLAAIRYVKIEVLSGRAEVDGIAAVPGHAMIAENFSTDPVPWRTHGNASLFAWNTNNAVLDVTWDSRETNSYFYRPLQTVLTRHDDFRFEFDLTLHDAQIGVTPTRPYTFEVALGLINLRSATSPEFVRGQFSGTRNIVEFDYFPPFSSFGATVASTIVSTNNIFEYSHNFPLEMTIGDLFRVRVDYTASNSTLVTTMTRNGEPFGPLESTRLTETFSDFRVDAFAISSYSDHRADGSILAHGSVDNVVIIYPEGPSTKLAGRLLASDFEARFASRTNWYYQLEHSADLKTWNPVGPLTAGTGRELILTHQNAGAHGFYRVRAERP